MSRIGSYGINAAFCSIIYNESPLDYPSRTMKQRGYTDANHSLSDEPYYDLPDSLTDVIKRTVWDIVTTYHRTGIDAGFLISSRKLPVAVVDIAYEVSLSTLNEQGTVTWSIDQGTLPQGLSLSQSGVMSGTPTQAGTAEVTILASDGTAQARRTYTMRVSANVPPEITTANLPSTALDEFIMLPLEATAGVGRKSWKVSSGELPHGIQLTPYGVLMGNPGRRGTYSFTLRVQDSYPAEAQSDERQFDWTIEDASTETARIKILSPETTFEHDGKLDESFWDLRYEVAKVAAGAPGISGAWDAVWTEDGAFYVAIEVFDGPEGADSAGYVDIYLDSRNNKELIYNQDDSHWRITRGGKRSALNGTHISTKAYVAETENGYTVEMRIAQKHFLGNGVTVGFGAGGVYGFDIGISEAADDTSSATKFWQGNAENDENTAAWGTIWLVTEEMTAARAPLPAMMPVIDAHPSVRISNNMIYIDQSAGREKYLTFRLFDCSGRLLISRTINNSLSIPCAASAGTYLYRFSGGRTRPVGKTMRLRD